MGIISSVKAVKNVEIIRNGGEAELSIAQIVNININLPDAKKKLDEKTFKEIFALFKEFQKCKMKVKYNWETYLKATEKVLMKFDEIAPYEKYCGINELELEIMSECMREEASTEEASTYENETDNVLFEKLLCDVTDYLCKSRPFGEITNVAYETQEVIIFSIAEEVYWYIWKYDSYECGKWYYENLIKRYGLEKGRNLYSVFGEINDLINDAMSRIREVLGAENTKITHRELVAAFYAVKLVLGGTEETEISEIDYILNIYENGFKDTMFDEYFAKIYNYLDDCLLKQYSLAYPKEN